jgi:hypothetical protein
MSNEFGLQEFDPNSPPPPVEACDVLKPQELAKYRKKRTEWLGWYQFRKDEPNNIEGQIIRMIFLDMSYRILAKPRGETPQDLKIAARNGLLVLGMPQIDQASFEAVQLELTSGESILWAAQPNASSIFHREDLSMIPFSLLWGGFAIFWEAGVTGVRGSSTTHPAPTFFMLWGIPFVVIGQYMIWGGFIVAAWKKRGTFYALTNRRAIVVQDGWSRKTASAYLDTLPALIKEGGSNGIGTLRFTRLIRCGRGGTTTGESGMA